MSPRSFFQKLYRSVLIAIFLVPLSHVDTAFSEAKDQRVTAPSADADSLPGAPAFDETLVVEIGAARVKQDPQYKPRTRHLRADGSAKYTNRLFLESSPYLLQHAHNPVNWYPWGNEAFEAAHKLGRPVFLSVGYSTCHWCHVMEEESFEDEEIARVLNENYIAIKVDREERPDVDAIYMSAVQLLTGRGGWPMTVWLTPDKKPLFGGTYFPPRDGDRGAQVGLLTLLDRIREVYDTEPDRIARAADEITERLRQNLTPPVGQGLPGAPVIHEAARFYKERFDSVFGGMQGAPKFPSSLSIRFLLRYHLRTGDKQSLQMAEVTLEKMVAGGIYDHVGGGFHRYSTDVSWLVPHFEKMLYDNAILALTYLEGYQATGREDFARVVREILRYVGRDMTSPSGAFYSATDADSLNPEGHREEGWFFTWTPEEIEAVLGEDRARVLTTYYDVTARGNFEGRSILNTPGRLDEIAPALGLSPEEVRSIVEESKELLYEARGKRSPPLRDEKILTSWNGLMISAFAQAALILEDEEYERRAEAAADFLLENLFREGRLVHSYKDGKARNNAFLSDYAFFAAGLLDLYEITGNPRWLRAAIDLDAVLEKFYEDKENGGFFMTPSDHENLLVREKPGYDGAEPSGNSVAVMNLLRFYEFTTEDRYRKRSENGLEAFNGTLRESPSALSEMLLATDFYLDEPKEVIIITPNSRAEAEPLLEQLRATFVPNRILAVVSEGEELESQAKLIPLLEGRIAKQGKATAYVCSGGICELPTTDPEVFAKLLREVKRIPLGR
jgi:hypothetical protein